MLNAVASSVESDVSEGSRHNPSCVEEPNSYANCPEWWARSGWRRWKRLLYIIRIVWLHLFSEARVIYRHTPIDLTVRWDCFSSEDASYGNCLGILSVFLLGNVRTARTAGHNRLLSSHTGYAPASYKERVPCLTMASDPLLEHHPSP